jgi:hypothetical protein
MLGKFVALFPRALAALQHVLFAAAQHPRIKKWRGEISSLDVQRERAMLRLRRCSGILRDLLPNRHRLKQDV